MIFFPLVVPLTEGSGDPGRGSRRSEEGQVAPPPRPSIGPEILKGRLSCYRLEVWVWKIKGPNIVFCVFVFVWDGCLCSAHLVVVLCWVPCDFTRSKSELSFSESSHAGINRYQNTKCLIVKGERGSRSVLAVPGIGIYWLHFAKCCELFHHITTVLSSLRCLNWI